MKTIVMLLLLFSTLPSFAPSKGPIWIEPILIESSNYEYIRSKNLVFGRKWEIQRTREYLYVYGQGLMVQESVYFPKVFGSPEVIINVGRGDYPDSGWRFTNSHRAFVLSVLRGAGAVYSPTTNSFVDLKMSPNPFYAMGVLTQENTVVKNVDRFRFVLKLQNDANEPRVVRFRFYFYRDGPDRPMSSGHISIFMDPDAHIMFVPTLELLSQTVGMEVTYGVFSNPLDPEITVP